MLPLVTSYDLGDGRRLNLLASGRVVNLAAGQGHPAAVMDMSFANQALAVEHLVGRAGDLGPGVHPVPDAVDREVARAQARVARRRDRRPDGGAGAVFARLGARVASAAMTTTDGRAECVEKMEAEGLPKAAVDTFTHYYDRLVAGETGLLRESEIEPLTDVPDADGADRGAERRGARPGRGHQAQRRPGHEHGDDEGRSPCSRSPTG